LKTKKIELVPDVERIANCTKYIKDSDKIKNILEIVLHLGNFLNNGNQRLGNAFGFQMETLTKLGDTKTSDNQLTILEVIVEMVQDSDKPEIVALTKQDLDIVEAGSKVSLQTIQGDLTKLTKDFEGLKTITTQVEKAGDDDVFHAKLNDFIEKTQADIDKLNTDFNAMNTNFEALVSFFGEDLKDNDPEKFYGKWKGFLTSLVEAKEKLITKRENEEKLKRREESKEKAKRGSTNPRGGGTEGGVVEEGGPGERGRGRGGPGRGDPRGRGRGRGGPGMGAQVVDELFGKLKDGGIFKRNN